jgi:O-antigen ligase
MTALMPNRAKALQRPLDDPSGTLLDLPPRRLWRVFSRQSFAFWGLCFYLFIEYVRPQSVWRSIDVLPWGQLALSLPVIGLLFERPRQRPFLPLDGLMLVFTGVLLASFGVAYDVSWSLDLLKTFINWILFYYLATRIVTSGPRFLIFLLTFMLWSLKMSQFGARAFVLGGFSFRAIGISGGPGWFQNSGEMAIQMCIFLGVSLHFILGLRHRWPRWKTLALLALLPGTAFLAVIMSSSRGGQLGAAAVLLFIVAQSKHRVRGLVTAGILLPALWFIVPARQKDRFASMGEDQSSISRLTYWHDGLKIMKDHPILGVGFNNWLPYYWRYYNPNGEVPHNIFIQAGSELGYTGLLALLALMFGTFYTNWKTRRLARHLGEWGLFFRSTAFGLDAALVGFAVPGFFVTVLYYPFFWVNLGLTAALHLVTWRHFGVQRRLVARRAALPASNVLAGAVAPR